MELKDVILSTLAEMENVKPEKKMIDNIKHIQDAQEKSKKELELEVQSEESSASKDERNVNSEILFLKSTRERLLVLFEGFQAPNNTNIEAKIDMTLNFLEYMLVTIDSRVEEIQRGSQI
ncbi:hypothetical protein [Sulfurimonas sp.]|jgi:hypothetical protein|uniref:CiaD-like domain-containing protein n=1 Tax=Sulfurimonas sp. TaxID=2022749 RepID=UPI0026002515|nr:hypothetical protein [Sulfurimonas sp.]MCK9472466.1 hypothetical protein [Sulfurimonas sp.]